MTAVDMFFSWGESLFVAFQNIYDYLTSPIPGFQKLFNDGIGGTVREFIAKLFVNDNWIDYLKEMSFADFIFSRAGIIFFTSVLLLSWVKRVFF